MAKADTCPICGSPDRPRAQAVLQPRVQGSRPAQMARRRLCHPRPAGRPGSAGHARHPRLRGPLFRGYACDARVAQLVEHATENRSVGGSNPSPGTTAERGKFSAAKCTTRQRGQRRVATTDDAALPRRLPVLLPRPVPPLDMAGELVGVEIDRAQIAGGVALRLIGEMRRARVAAFAARGDRDRADARAEFDHRDEAVAAGAVLALACPDRSWRRTRRGCPSCAEANGTAMLGAVSSKCGL